jgi:Piezo non-specific cation channel, R-Ras-binding domain
VPVCIRVYVGLIGLYLGLVLAIGRFIRLAVTDIYPRIPYEDMIDPKPIMSLVEDVIIARQHHELELEENLYWEVGAGQYCLIRDVFLCC